MAVGNIQSKPRVLRLAAEARLKRGEFFAPREKARVQRQRQIMAIIRQHGNSTPQRGTTLVELMVTIGIMSLLISVAVPIYRTALIGAKEAALRNQLRTLREYIDEYTIDKEKAPTTLDDLVSGGYLKELPTDPFTESSSTWKVEMDTAIMASSNMSALPAGQAPGQTEPGIADVHSGSDRVGLDGTPYSTW